MEVLDMRAATQGLLRFNRYVQIPQEAVRGIATRLAEELAAMVPLLAAYPPRKLLLQLAKPRSRGALHAMALHFATTTVEIQLQ